MNSLDLLSPCPWLTLTCLAALALLVYFLLPPIIRRFWEAWVVAMVPREEFPDLPLPPGTLGYPLIGETFAFLRKRSDFYKEKVEQYGNIYKTHLLFSPTIRVTGAEYVKRILLSENILVEHSWPRSTKLLLGTGSLTQSSGFRHRILRRHMLHVFSHDILNDMLPTMQKVITRYLRNWCSRRELLAYPECNSLAFTAAACAMLGLEMTSSTQSGIYENFQVFLKNLMSVPFDLPGFGFRKGMNAKRKLISILEKQIPETEKRPLTPVMQALKDSYKQLSSGSQQELYEGVLDILFASHETVSSVLTNCLMFLGQHTRVRDKLRAEVQTITSESLCYTTVNDLKYLNCVVKEVLRLCPPAGAGFRKVIKSFELGGYLIPRGWTVMFSIRETQHLSPVFPSPDSFHPERWETLGTAAGNGTACPERFHYIPFGFGVRGCVGKAYAQLMIKLFLIELIRTCDWELKSRDIVMEYIPIPKATDDLPVIFSERQKE